MKLTLFTPKGIEYETECKHIQINDQKTGSFGILENHVPVISIIPDGNVVVDSVNDESKYLVLKGAVIKFKNNEASIVAEVFTIGDTLEEAENKLNEYIENRKKENKARNVELALAENELKKQIKKTGAGNF